MKINNMNSNFQTITSGVPQGSIVGPILFKTFFKYFFFFLCVCSNALLIFVKTKNNLVF